MIIGVLGLIDSGKGTVSEILVNDYDFKKLSFADSLKETISAIFGWPLELLQGKTQESRIWREQVDEWWANRLGIDKLTPRWVLQNIGTELFRNEFHQDIWIASLQRKLNSSDNFVIDDCRFANEITALKLYGAKFIKVSRGKTPDWYDDAIETLNTGRCYMTVNHPEVHFSEWNWITQPVDYIIENNSDLITLKNKVDGIIKTITI